MGRVVFYWLRTLPLVDALLDSTQVNKGISAGEFVPQACYAAHRARKELSRVSDEFARARREFGCNGVRFSCEAG